MTETAAAYDAAPTTERFDPALPLDLIDPSPDNPRQRYDDASMLELTESIRQKGVITPVLVRPKGSRYELAAGHRRRIAARAAGRDTVPAVIRLMDDAEFLEVLVCENDHREDVHALEEAGGYQKLLALPGYDVARIAARVGRSVKYVYDRLKLLQLTAEAQRLFLEDRFTAGHAILLARLDAEMQAKAIDPDGDGLWIGERGFDWVDGDDDRSDADPYFHRKAVSVRELEHWISRNVRANRHEVDPVLFPETAALVGRAQELGQKIIPIMRLTQRPQAARSGDKILSEAMWKRADGLNDSKTCMHGELGVIEIGPGQHEAFAICRKRDRCTVHWADEIKYRKKVQAAREKATASGEDPVKAERDSHTERERKRKESEAQEKALGERWKKATPAMLSALAAAVKKAPLKPTGLLATMLTGAINVMPEDSQYVPIGKTAEDLVRHLAFALAAGDCYQVANQWGRERFTKQLQAFGIDAKKILNEAAPVEKPKAAVQTSAKAGKPTKGTCRKCGCTEEAACGSGCAWADATKTRCTACFRPKVSSSLKRPAKKKAQR
jgi:ParB/RepB/Spo0J family partition protein